MDVDIICKNLMSTFYNDSGFTTLHYAILHGCKDTAKTLLEKNVDVNSKSSSGSTPLHYAAHKQSPDFVKLLLEYNANVNSKNQNGETPFHCAIDGGSRDIVEMLLRHNAHINLAYKGTFPLHLATVREKPDIIRLLLQHNADVNSRDLNFYTPLHIACAHNRKDMVEIFLQHHADVNSKCIGGLTPLHSASMVEKNSDIINLLLEHGAEVNCRDVYDSTPLHNAAENGCRTIAQALLNSGADVNSRDKLGATPLHVAARNQRESTFLLLLDSDADINIANKFGKTAFSFLRNKKFYLIKHIVKKQAANFFVCDKNLQTLNEGFKYYHVEINKFQEECEQEIKKMKERVICNGSFYDILTNNLNQVARYVGDTNTVKVQLCDSNAEFPIYAAMLYTQISKGKVRNDLLKNLYQCNTSYLTLPMDCIEMIVGYINNNELQNLIKSFQLAVKVDDVENQPSKCLDGLQELICKKFKS